MNKLGTWVVAWALIAAVVNTVLTILWFSFVHLESSTPVSARGYTIETLALNVTILGLVMVLIGFIFTILGFFGYVEIKKAAEERAKEIATQVASEQMTRFFEQQAPRIAAATVTLGSHEAKSPAPDSVSEAQEGE